MCVVWLKGSVESAHTVPPPFGGNGKRKAWWDMLRGAGFGPWGAPRGRGAVRARWPLLTPLFAPPRAAAAARPWASCLYGLEATRPCLRFDGQDEPTCTVHAKARGRPAWCASAMAHGGAYCGLPGLRAPICFYMADLARPPEAAHPLEQEGGAGARRDQRAQTEGPHGGRGLAVLEVNLVRRHLIVAGVIG